MSLCHSDDVLKASEQVVNQVVAHTYIPSGALIIDPACSWMTMMMAVEGSDGMDEYTERKCMIWKYYVIYDGMVWYMICYDMIW